VPARINAGACRRPQFCIRLSGVGCSRRAGAQVALAPQRNFSGWTAPAPLAIATAVENLEELLLREAVLPSRGHGGLLPRVRRGDCGRARMAWHALRGGHELGRPLGRTGRIRVGASCGPGRHFPADRRTTDPTLDHLMRRSPRLTASLPKSITPIRDRYAAWHAA
jgi:hypothetical protein